MPPVPIILLCAAIGMGFYIEKPIVKAAKKTGHAIVHVVTLGKK